MNSLLLSLVPGTEINIEEKQIRILREVSAKVFRVDSPPLFIQEMLQLLSKGAYNEQNLLQALKNHPLFDPLYFYYFVQQLGDHGLLSYSLESNKEIIAVLEPMTQPMAFKDSSFLKNKAFCLSRFAYIHTVDQDLLLESPMGYARLWIKHPLVSNLLFILRQPVMLDELVEKEYGLTKENLKGLIDLLHMSGALTYLTENKKTEEEENTTLRQWEFHDLLFHTRSRKGMHDYPYGATFRFEQQIPPLPALKPLSLKREEELIYLPKIDDEKFSADPPFQTVIEKRQSERKQKTSPLTLIQLSEFLYRSARVKAIIPENKTHTYPSSRRPYPGGGAMYELEIYLTLHASQELQPDLYHYNPLHHALLPLKVKESDLLLLLHDAKRTCGQNTLPHILITLTARFQRMSWKYQSMAYATILKDVGVIYQNFYLAACAMNLAACALGGGNASFFAKITNLNYYAESSVGEFIIGSRIDP